MDNNFELDLTLLSKELKLLLELLKEENEETIQRNKKELFSDIDWNHFLHLARHHRVYPLMYMRVKNMDESLIPKEVIETLYQDYKRNTFRMLRLSAEMEKISKLFNENGVRLLILKGPVLAKEIYDDISLRTSKDLDVLIEEKDLEIAGNLLLSLGYEKEDVPTILNERSWRYHHVLYFHPKLGTQIEIHWRMNPFPMKEPTFNELWLWKKTSSLTQYPVHYLGEKALFMYLVSHGARHGWRRLRWLKDIDQMLRKERGFEGGYILLEKYKYSLASGQAFILASRLLQTPINGEMRDGMEGSRSEYLANMAYSYIRDDKYQPSYKSYLWVLKKPSQKFSSILLFFYPAFVDTKVLNLPRSFHFLYFILRPFLWTWRKTKQLISS